LIYTIFLSTFRKHSHVDQVATAPRVVDQRKSISLERSSEVGSRNGGIIEKEGCSAANSYVQNRIDTLDGCNLRPPLKMLELLEPVPNEACMIGMPSASARFLTH
jgi:hypothetical protein